MKTKHMERSILLTILTIFVCFTNLLIHAAPSNSYKRLLNDEIEIDIPIPREDSQSTLFNSANYVQHDFAHLVSNVNSSETEVEEVKKNAIPTTFFLSEHSQLAKAPSNIKLEPPPIWSHISNSFCKAQHAGLYWIFPQDNEFQPDYYLVYKRNNYNQDEGWQQLYFDPQVTETHLVVKELYPNTPYSFKVKAMWNDGRRQSYPSEPFNCTTLVSTPVRNPQFMSAYRVFGESVPTILVKWKPLEKSEQGHSDSSYNIKLFKQQSEFSSESESEPDEVSLVFIHNYIVTNPEIGEYKIIDSNLNADEKFWVSVQAQNPVGNASAKLMRYQIIFQESKPSLAPTAINVTEVIDGASVVLSWKPVPIESVNGNFKGWLILI